MRFVVPILSLVGLVIISIWIMSSGQFDTVSMTNDLSTVTAIMPYLLLVVLALQGVFVYLQFRSAHLITQSCVIEMGAAEEASNNSVEQMNTEWVLDALAGGVVVTDQQGKITYMNISAERLTLWSREKVLGEHVSKILKLEDLQGNPLGERAFEANQGHSNP